MKKIYLLFLFTITAVFCDKLNLSYYKRFLPKDPVILDCGAHTGTSTMQFLRCWPKATVYCVEADPFVYKKLLKRVGKYKNVYTFNQALNSRDGEVDFYPSKKITGLSSNHGGQFAQGSVLPPNESHVIWKEDWHHIKFKDPIRVQGLTLDSFMKKNQIKKIDFMWLDMQGNDFNMLMAAGRVLDDVKLIQIEISSSEFYKDTVLFQEGKKYLESRGFTFIAVNSDYHKNGMGDALFIRK